MKFKPLLILTCLLVVTLALTAGKDEDAWFDMENCSLCKSLMAEEGLIENMKMDNYVISTGWMVVAHLPEEYKEAHANAKKNMEKTVEKLMAGEEMYMCNFCMSYGALMMAGAQMESFESGAAEISLATSTDPAVIAQIQKHAKRTKKEMAAMQGDGHGEHDGHGH